MGSLQNSKPKESYQSLLKLETNGITSNLKTIEDGAGADTALELSSNAAKVNGTFQVTGNTDVDGDLDLNGDLNFTTAPNNGTNELSALLLDSNNTVVKRNLDASAFSSSSLNSYETITVDTQGMANLTAGSADTLNFISGTGITFSTDASNDNLTIATTGIFQPSFIALRHSSSSTSLSDDYSSYTIAPVSNTQIDRSHSVDPNSDFSIASNNLGVDIVRAGLYRIDVSLIFNITANNTQIDIQLNRTPSGGTETPIREVGRTFPSTGQGVVSYSIYAVLDVSDLFQYKIGLSGSSPAASLTNGGTVTLTKLT